MIEIAPLTPLSDPAAAASPAVTPPRSSVEPGAFRDALGNASPASASAPTSTAPGADRLGERFEAAVLTPLMAAILPPEDSSVWGGQAGKLWRGLFAEELAAATSASGGVGIGQLIDEAVASRYQPARGDEG